MVAQTFVGITCIFQYFSLCKDLVTRGHVSRDQKGQITKFPDICIGAPTHALGYTFLKEEKWRLNFVLNIKIWQQTKTIGNPEQCEWYVWFTNQML